MAYGGAPPFGGGRPTRGRGPLPRAQPVKTGVRTRGGCPLMDRVPVWQRGGAGARTTLHPYQGTIRTTTYTKPSRPTRTNKRPIHPPATQLGRSPRTTTATATEAGALFQAQRAHRRDQADRRTRPPCTSGTATPYVPRALTLPRPSGHRASERRGSTLRTPYPARHRRRCHHRHASFAAALHAPHPIRNCRRRLPYSSPCPPLRSLPGP